MVQDMGDEGRPEPPVPELTPGYDVLDEPVGACAPREVFENMKDARRDRHAPVLDDEEMSPGIGEDLLPRRLERMNVSTLIGVVHMGIEGEDGVEILPDGLADERHVALHTPRFSLSDYLLSVLPAGVRMLSYPRGNLFTAPCTSIYIKAQPCNTESPHAELHHVSRCQRL